MGREMGETLRENARGLNRSPCKAAALTVLLYGATVVWFSQIGYSQFFSYSDEMLDLRFAWRLAYTIGLLFAAVSLFALCPRIRRRSAPVHWSVSAAALAGTLVVIGSVRYAGAPLALLLAAYGCVAAGSVWFSALAVNALAGLRSMSWAMGVAVGGAALSQTVLPLIQAFVPAYFQWLPMTVALIAAIAAGVFLLPRMEAPPFFRVARRPGGAEPKMRSLLSFLWERRAAGSLILGSALAVTAVRGVGPYGMWGRHLGLAAPNVDFAAFGLSMVLFVVLEFVTVVLLAKAERPRSLSVPFAAFALGFAVVVLSVQFGAPAVISDGLTQCLYLHCCGMVLFYPSQCWECFKTDPVRMGSVAQGLQATFALLWMALIEQHEMIALVVALVASYAFMFVALRAKGGDLLLVREARSSSDEAREASPLDSRNRLADEYGLTQREREILGYLLQARSLPYISEALFISEGTTRTHTRNIYRKLNIHSKQELISLAMKKGEE